MNESEEMQPMIFLAGGGHARVLLNAVKDSGRKILGILDDALAAGSYVNGVPILGGESLLERYPPTIVQLVNGIGSAEPRWALYRRFTARGYTFASITDPSAVVAAGTICEPGVQIMAGAVVQPGVRLGANVVVNTRVAVDHDCRVDNDVLIGPGAVLCGGVIVEKCVVIGPGAVVVRGCRLAVGSMVAAGAVVVDDIAAGARVFGVPARPRIT